jgi:methylenetetrahydrofolate dehydrogenase (NADP+)/methenyltetrahydrofolate cyclohydrolase
MAWLLVASSHGDTARDDATPGCELYHRSARKGRARGRYDAAFFSLTGRSDSMTARVIDGRKIAEQTRAEHAAGASRLTAATGVVPHLAAVLVGEDPASAVYVRNKQLACQKAGMKSSLHRLAASTSERELLDLVARLNGDSDVHGILVQLPLPKSIDAASVLDAIDPSKDVDGFHPENVGLLQQGRPRFQPCTPAGIMRMLQASGIDTPGRHAVVIGRSDIVGKPMAMLLAQKGADATVTLCHSRTRDIAQHTRQADLVIAAVGIPRFVQGDWIRPGAVVIDVGINRVEDKLVGDVDYAQAAAVAAAITPVPGGVGPMTIAMLLGNTLLAASQLTARAARPRGASPRLEA